MAVLAWQRCAGGHGGAHLGARGRPRTRSMAVTTWRHQGVWPRLRAHRQAQPDLSAVRLDSTVVRAHVSVAGAPKHKEAEPARGRSRGGFGTQIHILADLRGCPLRLRVTDGQRHDSL